MIASNELSGNWSRPTLINTRRDTTGRRGNARNEERSKRHVVVAKGSSAWDLVGMQGSVPEDWVDWYNMALAVRNNSVFAAKRTNRLVRTTEARCGQFRARHRLQSVTI
jgi:hypothetical protein